MAQYDNVNYTHYSDVMGRSTVPDADTFDELSLEVVLEVKSLVQRGLIREKESGGIDDACCMMVEEVYKARQTESGAYNVDTSEIIGGYSHGMSAKASDIAVEKNAKSLEERKYKWLKLYCDILSGVM